VSEVAYVSKVRTVSNLDRDGSLKVASDLAPPVYEFLPRLEA